MPLFPNSSGLEITMHTAVATINSLVHKCGRVTVDSTGCQLYGGHSFRTGGAHFLASKGINPVKIQTMGRWTSPLVMHYAGDAMADGIAADLHISLLPCSLPHPELCKIVDALAARITELESKPMPVPPGDRLLDVGSYVCNLSTNCWHYTLSRPGWPAEDQRANCGWAFMYVRHARQINMPVGKKLVFCKRCRPSSLEPAGKNYDVPSDID